MAISDSLNRRIRARPDEDDDVYETASTSDEMEEGSDEELASDEELEDAGSSMEEDEDDSDVDEEDEDDADKSDAADEREAVQAEFSQISFGALAKAQESIGKSLGKRKRSDSSAKAATSNNGPSALDDIRARLREAREKREESKEKPKRSSKHAPTVQSSKHAVSRKRVVVEQTNVPKPRDPRFDPAVMSRSGSKHSTTAINQAYSFLDEYRASEIKQMKEQLAKTKDPAQKEELKRAITSATDRQRALENKRREQEVLAEHRKRERQLLREGKKSKPYFLKKSEIKRQVLKKKYESMGAKERAKALERRRKKLAAKEKKEMPWGRRTLQETSGGDGGGAKPKKGHR